MELKKKALADLRVRLIAYDAARKREQITSAEPVIEAARALLDRCAAERAAAATRFAERQRRVVAARKAAGLCRCCGKVPPRAERTSCAECGRRDVENSMRQYDTMRRKPKREG